MLAWRLYYGDGSTFDSEQGSWADAPARNVQFLLTPEESVGREIDSGKDFYLWWPGAPKPWGADMFGLLDYLTEIGHEKAAGPLNALSLPELEAVGVKFGRSLDNETYRARHARAIADSDFPKKSARLPRERTP